MEVQRLGGWRGYRQVDRCERSSCGSSERDDRPSADSSEFDRTRIDEVVALPLRSE